MKKIKGVNVWPQAVDEAVFRHAGVEEYQVVLSRDESESDIATVRVMPKPEMMTQDTQSLCENIRRELRNHIGIGFNVTIVSQGQLSHSEYKARRWIDERNSTQVAP
jgi:phenylacetate-CoA ligase